MKLARQRQDAASGAQNPGTAAKEDNDIQDLLFQHRNSLSVGLCGKTTSGTTRKLL